MKVLSVSSGGMEGDAREMERTIRNLLRDAGFREDAKVYAEMLENRIIFRQHLTHECERCHRIDGTVVCHHVLGKGAHPNVRDLPENWAFLCYRHHVEDPQFSAHLTPKLFMEWMVRERGEDWHRSLLEKARQHGSQLG